MRRMRGSEIGGLRVPRGPKPHPPHGFWVRRPGRGPAVPQAAPGSGSSGRHLRTVRSAGAQAPPQLQRLRAFPRPPGVRGVRCGAQVQLASAPGPGLSEVGPSLQAVQPEASAWPSGPCQEGRAPGPRPCCRTWRGHSQRHAGTGRPGGPALGSFPGLLRNVLGAPSWPLRSPPGSPPPPPAPRTPLPASAGGRHAGSGPRELSPPP